MAHLLTITYASTTLSINAGDYSPISYAPLIGDGKTVTETCQLRIKNATAAGLKADENALWLAAREAADYQAGGSMGNQVFLNIQPNGAAAAFRSEIISMSLVASPTLLETDWKNTASTNLVTTVTITWTRRDWWEGPTTAPTLTTSRQADNPVLVYNPNVFVYGTVLSIVKADKHFHTSDVAVMSLAEFAEGNTVTVRGSGAGNNGDYTVAVAGEGNGDATHPLVVVEAPANNESANASLEFIGPRMNVITLSANQALGDIESPGILTIINQSGATLDDLIIANNYNAILGTTQLKQTTVSGDWTATSHVNASGGYQYQTTLAAGYHELTWLLNSVHAANYYGIMVRFAANPPANTTARCSFSIDSTGTYVEYGKEVILDATTNLQLVDIFPIAPFIWKLVSGTLTDCNFRIEFKNAAGGTLMFDYLELLSMDNYCRLSSISGLGLPDTYTLTVDSVQQTNMVEHATSHYFYMDFAVSGGYPMFKPGVINQLAVYCKNASGYANIGYKLSVELAYYPRYRNPL